MGTMEQTPKMEGSMILTMIGSLLGHIIFGITVSKSVGLTYCSNKSCATKTLKKWTVIMKNANQLYQDLDLHGVT